MRTVGLVVLGLVACKSHQYFETTPSTATPQERVELYTRLVGTHEKATFYSDGGQERTILMADGSEVDYPEDLIPLVGEESSTAKHARVASRARILQLEISLAGVAAFAAGVAVTFRSMDQNDSAGIVGPALVIGGLVAAVGVGTYYRRKSYRETHEAYRAFNADFAAKLNVCASGLYVVPCENVAPISP